MATGKGAAASGQEEKTTPFSSTPGPFDPATWLEWSRQAQANGRAAGGMPGADAFAALGAFPGGAFPGAGFPGTAFPGIKIAPAQLAEIQQRFMQGFTDLWRAMAAGDQQQVQLTDRRFAGDAWRSNAPYRYAAAFYLLTARAMS